jgi:murein DD-endopeptidase MepM/ murein hydrolase activator NlpD
MALRAIAASPGFVGKVIVVSAIGLTSAAWLMHKPVSETADVALPESATGIPASQPASTGASPASEAAVPPAFRVETAVVEHSFAEAAQRLGVDAETTARLTRAFSGRLDFRRDLQRGSEIRFVFRNDANGVNGQNDAPAASGASDVKDAKDANSGATQDTQPSADTPVAIRISTGKTSHDLFLYRNLAGKAFYYSADGHAAAPSFLRYPVKFTRISSHFAKRRLNPVTHRIQPHEGVDFAAPVGTPVYATARGTVTFAGWQTGYGKVVKLDNFGPYSTTFAHLSRFSKNLKVGQAVQKGQVIGYVGATGWATGPHLHYEVHVDQVAQNPLTVDLPHRDPLQGEDRLRFAQQVARMDALL